ncbi:MAG TPA: DUF4157 domain-containing protein [Pyrinomonadaceae bacterium]|nr:DUF4157 domain-containing protein [Pyrinomonadaceae bacterium]
MKQARDELWMEAKQRGSGRPEGHQADETLAQHPLLQLQHAAGNQAVSRLVASEDHSQPDRGTGHSEDGLVAQRAPAFPTKLTGDALEQEADHVAGQVVGPARLGNQPPTISSNASQSTETSSRGNDSVQAGLETQLGIEHGSVRVHTDERAHLAAHLLHARAFTVGNDVVFARNEYSTSTGEGQRLLAHELVHVAQQRQNPAAGKTPMRDVKVPAAKELEWEVATLRMRLAQIIEQETKRGRSIAERGTIERRIALLESVAGEPDPNRQKIIYLRARIRQLRDDIKVTPPSSAKETVARDIQEHERDLAKALEANVARIEKEILSLYEIGLSPEISKQIRIAESELLDNEAELKILRRIFTPEKASSVAQIYKKQVRPDMSGHCMGAVYKGIEAIHSPAASAETEAQVRKDSRKILKETKIDTNNVDRIMETLRQHSRAGEKVLVKYNRRRAVWEPSAEKTLLGLVSIDYPGWYFFGLSVSGAYHSVILAVDNSEGSPRIYWMDQFSKGFTNEVTGKLDKKMKEFVPSYGYEDSAFWPLIPSEGAVVEIK